MAVDQQPLISIVTVVLNGVKTVEEAFQSVCRQSFTDYEYVVVDGGSIDGTVDVIHKYKRCITTWVSEPDDGVYDAMSKALKMTKGQWILFLGADDFLVCDLRDVAALLQNQQTVYYGDVVRPAVKRIYDGFFSPYKLACRNICHQSIFYPRHVLEKNVFDSRYKVFADYELNMRLFSHPDILFEYIPVIVATFNDSEGLSPNQIDREFEADRLRLIKKYFQFKVYVFASCRCGLIRLLDVVGMKKMVMKAYHFILRYI